MPNNNNSKKTTLDAKGDCGAANGENDQEGLYTHRQRTWAVRTKAVSMLPRLTAALRWLSSDVLFTVHYIPSHPSFRHRPMAKVANTRCVPINDAAPKPYRLLGQRGNAAVTVVSGYPFPGWGLLETRREEWTGTRSGPANESVIISHES